MSDISYILTAQAYKPDLVKDEDWPDFDENFHDLLTQGACAEVLPAFGKPEFARTFEAMYERRIKEFKSYLNPSPGLVTVASDVQSGASGNSPRAPWIRGVHRGLASSQ